MALGITTSYWLVSRLDWLPLWHRRYFVAVLPLFASAVGGSVGVVAHRFQDSGRRQAAATMITLLILLGLGRSQGTFRRAWTAPKRLVVRGENWRDAVRWVETNAAAADAIYLDSGLIESRQILGTETPLVRPVDREFLLFPVSGPYGSELSSAPVPVHPSLRRLDIAGPASQGEIWLISRRDQASLRSAVTPSLRGNIRGFGGVSVATTRSSEHNNGSGLRTCFQEHPTLPVLEVRTR
jgi:hypothetical protein